MERGPARQTSNGRDVAEAPSSMFEGTLRILSLVYLANHRQIVIDGTDPYPAYCLFPITAPTTIEALMKCVHIIDVTTP
jgi:hypothetical protein